MKKKGKIFSKGVQIMQRGWTTLLAAVPLSDVALLSRLFQMWSDGWNSLNPTSICSHWTRCPAGVRPSLVLWRGRSGSSAHTNRGLGRTEPSSGRVGFRQSHRQGMRGSGCAWWSLSWENKQVLVVRAGQGESSLMRSLILWSWAR